MPPRKLRQWKDTNYWVSREGRVFKKTGIVHKEIKTWFNKNNGRYRFSLSISGEKKHVYRYRMIWEAWKGETGDLTIDHIDGNKTNDTLSNLQLLTREDNIRKCYLNNEED